MDPLTIGIAGAGLASAIGGMITSAKARKANAAELKRLQEMWDKIVPPEYDLSPNDPPEYITEKLQGAQLDFSKLTPEEFKVVGTYSPESAKYVQEIAPTLVKGNAASKEGRAAQIDALRNFQQIAKGENPELRANMEDASRMAQQQAQSRTQSLLQDSQRRGGLNSGLSYAAMLQGNSDSMQTGAANSRAAAIEAYKSKINAIQQSGEMGRSLANDELSQEQTNAGIINDFNQRTSKNYQAYLQHREEVGNQAQLYNLQTAQSASDKNTAQNNSSDQWNLQNQNSLAQQQYGNTRDERNYQNTLAASEAQWSAAEKERQNNLKTSAFNNQTQIANGKAGIGAMAMNTNNQNAANTNQAIAGIAQVGAGALSAQQEDQRWKDYFASQGKYATAQSGK